MSGRKLSFIAEPAPWIRWGALCNTAEGSKLQWFTGTDDVQPSNNRDQWAEQRTMCASCPVIDQCYEDAIKVDMVFQEGRGVGFHFRAGMTPMERWRRAKAENANIDLDAKELRARRKASLDSEIKLDRSAVDKLSRARVMLIDAVEMRRESEDLDLDALAAEAERWMLQDA